MSYRCNLIIICVRWREAKTLMCSFASLTEKGVDSFLRVVVQVEAANCDEIAYYPSSAQNNSPIDLPG